jgi:O-antigen/teichoic acid export membrane protein
MSSRSHPLDPSGGDSPVLNPADLDQETRRFMQTATIEPAEAVDEAERRRHRFGKTHWAVADQVLISATNFILMILLARGLSNEAFGGFSLIYSVLLFANALQSALVTQAHNVLGVRYRGEEYARYTTSAAIFQLVLVASICLLALVAWAFARISALAEAPLLLALVPAILGWQLQEFARRVLYTERRLAAAFANDLVSYGCQSLVIAALWWMESLTAPLALYALATTSAAAALLGGWQIRGSLRRRVDPAAFRENWHYGKWLTASAFVGHWLSAESFTNMAAAMLGVASAGILRAVNLVFGPTRVLYYVFLTMLPIRFSRTLADEGEPALRAQLKKVYLAAIPMIGGYCLLVAVFAEPLLWLFYGDKYAGNGAVLTLYAALTFLVFMSMIVTAALLANRQTRHVFLSQLLSGVLAIPVGATLIHAVGVRGAVLGMIASNLALYAILNFFLTRSAAPSPSVPREEPSGAIAP